MATNFHPKSYQLKPKKYFAKKFNKLIAKNKTLENRLELVFDKMTFDPFDLSLRTHKVRSKLGIEAYSSRVTGGLRIIWDFNGTNITILDLLDIDGHGGGNGVY